MSRVRESMQVPRRTHEAYPSPQATSSHRGTWKFSSDLPPDTRWYAHLFSGRCVSDVSKDSPVVRMGFFFPLERRRPSHHQSQQMIGRLSFRVPGSNFLKYCTQLHHFPTRPSTGSSISGARHWSPTMLLHQSLITAIFTRQSTLSSLATYPGNLTASSITASVRKMVPLLSG